MSGIVPYDTYNREERALCAHLFRLLHERLEGPKDSPLRRFLTLLEGSELHWHNGQGDLTTGNLTGARIYCEVAIIRDAYKHRQPHVGPFMDELSQLLMRQEKVPICRPYTQLPDPLNDGRLTHPRQILRKAIDQGIALEPGEYPVYGAMQALFNAKPDLVIALDHVLLVCEAKHTEPFDRVQLDRTQRIAEVLANLLHEDLGYAEPPPYAVFKLGATAFNPHINWSDIAQIADETYEPQDRTRISINAGAELLKRRGLG